MTQAGTVPRCEEAMPEPLGFFLTWSTYGTWLPGDGRGWIEYRHGWKLPDPARELEARAKMREDACVLDREQRDVVERTVREHCALRGWVLHEVNCRSNHLHVVVSAPVHPNRIRVQLKAWCTRRLKELERMRSQGRRGAQIRKKWWAERGSKRYINDGDSLEAAIRYVRDGQDDPE